MMHKAWSSIEEVPYCFSMSSVKFQGHIALKIVKFDPNCAFPDCNSSLNSPMAMKCCTKLETAKKRCPIVFQGHPSNFKVTRDKTSPILTQIGRFRTIGRSQLSNPSDLPCFVWKVVPWNLVWTETWNQILEHLYISNCYRNCNTCTIRGVGTIFIQMLSFMSQIWVKFFLNLLKRDICHLEKKNIYHNFYPHICSWTQCDLQVCQCLMMKNGIHNLIFTFMNEKPIYSMEIKKVYKVQCRYYGWLYLGNDN